MTKGKFRRKNSPSGSLAKRVFFTALILLVLPLSIHTFFLYRAGYLQKISDIQMTIRVIGDGQRALLEERMHLLWNILEAAEKNTPDQTGAFHMTAIPLPPKAPKHFAAVTPKSLFVGIAISDTRALVLKTPTSELLRQLTHFEEAPYPISLALINRKGEIIAGSIEQNALSEKIALVGANFFLLLSVSKDKIHDLNVYETLVRSLVLAFLIIALGGTLVFFLAKRIGKPLQSLASTMQRVGSGATHARYTPDWMGFEINFLGKKFNETLDLLLQNQKEIETEKLKRERLAEELRIGRDLQQSLLPKHLPSTSGIDTAALFLPALELGGDFYDLLPLQDGSLFIAIADAAGKGISACLHSISLRSSLRTLATQNLPLQEIALSANDLFFQDVQNSGMFVTLWLGIYDPKKHTLTYTCQGHMPPLLKRNQNLIELSTPGIALGAQTSDTATIKTIPIEPHDLLFLYTDGVTDAQSPTSTLYGSKRLKELLSHNDTSATHLTELILADLSTHTRGAPQYDDITLLAIHFK